MDNDSSTPVVEADRINIRSTALIVLCVIALVVFLKWGEGVFAPIVLGMLLSYALYPIVSFMHQIKIPRAIGAAFVVFGLIGATFFAGSSLQGQAIELLDKVPTAIQKFSRNDKSHSADDPSVLDKVREAAKEVEQAAEESGISTAPPKPPGVTRVVVEEAAFDLDEYLLGGSVNALVLISQFLSVMLLVYFILASGRMYKQKLVKISGETLSKKKLTVEILDDINRQLRLFFFVMLVGAVFVGFFTWIAFWWIGVDQAPLWGTIAGIASVVPYLGPGIVFLATGVAGFIQFGSLATGFFVAAVSLIITSIQGNLLTPWMTSRAAAMNAVGIFISLIFWGWLWGPIGLIVATPILLITKSVCDHVENLQNIGEMLGD